MKEPQETRDVWAHPAPADFTGDPRLPEGVHNDWGNGQAVALTGGLPRVPVHEEEAE